MISCRLGRDHSFSCPVRYTGPLLEHGALQAATEAGLGSPHYMAIVASLCSELKSLLSTQEAVTTPTGGCGLAYTLLYVSSTHCNNVQVQRTVTRFCWRCEPF